MFSSSKVELVGEEVGKGTSNREDQGMRLVPFLWHKMSVKNTNPKYTRTFGDLLCVCLCLYMYILLLCIFSVLVYILVCVCFFNLCLCRV